LISAKRNKEGIITVSGLEVGEYELFFRDSQNYLYVERKGHYEAEKIPIEDEKEFDINVKVKDNVFLVEISYIGYYTESKFENDLSEPYRYTMVLIVKVGDMVYRVVKDIVSELETIYNADLPEVKTEYELKELVNNEN